MFAAVTLCGLRRPRPESSLSPSENRRPDLVHLVKGSSSGITTTGSQSYSVTSLKLSYTRLGGPSGR